VIGGEAIVGSIVFAFVIVLWLTITWNVAEVGITVGLGFYLPFNIVLTYSIGTVLRLVTDARLGSEYAEEKGIPIAAGFIVGEALVGVAWAIRAVFGG